MLNIAEIHERYIADQGKQIAAHTHQILGLGEVTRYTDDRLNVLINIIERQISEGRNGKP